MIKKSELKLVKHDSPFLKTPPSPFDFKGDLDASLFANILLDKMRDYGGVGLSANQVGVNVSVFAMGINEVGLVVFNPKIIGMSKEEVSIDEGCLSFPGVYVKVKRPANIEVEYQDVSGEIVRKTFTGLSARIFLHEYDHMQGITMKDRVSKLKWDLAFNRMIKRTKRIIRKGVQTQLMNIQKQMETS
jgi:peptide deformylase